MVHDQLMAHSVICTFIRTTLISEGLLVLPGKITVPRQEGSLYCLLGMALNASEDHVTYSVVDSQGLIDVCGHPVVETTFSSRNKRRRRVRLLLLETFDSYRYMLFVHCWRANPYSQARSAIMLLSPV